MASSAERDEREFYSDEEYSDGYYSDEYYSDEYDEGEELPPPKYALDPSPCNH